MRNQLTLLLTIVAASAVAQTTAPKALLGTVSAVRPESGDVDVKPDSGAVVTIKVGSATIAQRIEPGQTDLSKAETIRNSDLAAGDRVLVTFGADSAAPVRRVIVIAATDIAKRDAADRLDWQRRGVTGIVTAISGNDFTLELHSLSGAMKYTVTAGPKTSFKRYASDSVRYADAAASSLAELAVGDQVRARGQKSPDGLHVNAEDVVFGTFLSKAGIVTAIDPATRQLTIKDLSNNKPVVVKFMADSKVKRMPDAAAMSALIAAAGRGGPPGASGAQAPSAPAPAPAPAAAASGAAGRGPAAQSGPDIAQILDLLPPIRFEDLKSGEVVVVSAMQGAKPDQITAITFLANADTLVQLAMAARGADAAGPAPSLAGLASSIGSVGP